MSPYRESFRCHVCETRITVSAIRRGHAGPVTTPFSVVCPTCDTSLSFQTPYRIDEDTVGIVGFASKPAQLRPRSLD
jgi:hypothetical protein